MNRFRIVTGALITAVLGIATAQAGSASSGDEGVTRGVTDSEIHVGGVYHQAFFADFRAGAEARIQRANDEGGVHGRTIVVDEWIDDGADPTAHVDAARQLVERNGVFALLDMSAASAGVGDYLAEQRVPYFGWGISQGWCNPMAFSIAGGSCPTELTPESPDFPASMQRILPDGSAEGQTVAIVSEDNDQAVAVAESMKQYWEDHGAAAEVFRSLPTPPTVVSDFSPYVLDVQDLDADAVVLTTSAANTLGMIGALQAADFEGAIINFVSYDPRLAPMVQGVYTQIQSMQPFEAAADEPAVQQMIDDIEGSGADVTLSMPAAAGYLSADLLIAALDAVGPDLTVDSFEAAVDGFAYDFGGAAGPVSFPEHHTASNGCMSIVVGTGEGFEIAAPLECFPLADNPRYQG